MDDSENKKSITEMMADIDAYLFKYKPEAQMQYGGQNGIDDNEHVGVMAQELLANPLTESAVNTEGDYLTVDTEKLIMILAAVTSDMAKEIEELKGRVDRLENIDGGM